MRRQHSGTILAAGSSGFIGVALIERLAKRGYDVVGLDFAPPKTAEPGYGALRVDLTRIKAPPRRSSGLARRTAGGWPPSCIVHLAAYYDLSGEESPKYDAVTVRGTERRLRGLRESFDSIERFIFASTMLVHRPSPGPAERIDEDSPIEPKWPYPKSKARTEEVHRAPVPSVPPGQSLLINLPTAR